MEELNKKIAEWVGYQKSVDGVGWWYPAGLSKTLELPPFTTSLDADLSPFGGNQ